MMCCIKNLSLRVPEKKKTKFKNFLIAEMQSRATVVHDFYPYI